MSIDTEYASSEKRKYRQSVYEFFSLHTQKPVRDRRVLYLDAANGLETKLLINAGYHTDNLYCVNRSSAIFAHITRSIERHPHTAKRLYRSGQSRHMPIYYKCDVLDFYSTHPYVTGSYDLVHLDLCSPLTEIFSSRLSDFVRTLQCKLGRSESCILTVNILRAREPGGFLRTICMRRPNLQNCKLIRYPDGTEASFEDKARLMLLVESLNPYSRSVHIHNRIAAFHAFRWGVYMGDSPMLWCSVKIGRSIKSKERNA